MLNTPLDAVPSYTISLDGPQQTVSATLRRAVSRVDVLFIRAEKDAATGVYTEKAGGDVFGPEKLAGVKLAYTGANSRNFMKAHGNNVGVLPFTVVEAPKCGYKQTITGEVNEKSLTAAVNLAKTKCK